VILLGFKNGSAGRMAPVRVRAAELRRSAGTASVLGLRTGGRRRGYCTKASGRRVVRRVPLRARRARLLLVRQLFLRRAAYAVTRRQARGALRAPLKGYRKSSPVARRPSRPRHTVVRLRLIVEMKPHSPDQTRMTPYIDHPMLTTKTTSAPGLCIGITRVAC
jgi:hypothetical protein